VKITDFGVARLIDSTKTNTGAILGSPLYMSPEQLKGEKVTPHTDIYSLGVTLFQLLTAQLPFSGDTLAGLTYNIINEKPKNIRDLRPDLPKSITRIINKALNKDISKRYQNVKEFAQALKNSVDDDFE
jgi:eukaryotic-like serine/threonine-protein kinase